MNVRLFLKEALRSIRANAAISTAAIVTVLITGFILGTALASYLYIKSEVDNQQSRVDVQAYIRDDATPDQVNALQRRILSTPHVKSATYISKDEALAIMKKRLNNPALTQLLPANPLPASFDITPDNADNASSIMKTLAGDPALQGDKNNPTGLSDGGAVTSKLLQASRFITWSGLALVLTLLVSSVLLIANTIRLSVFARRREVEVMKLVGATNWFIRWPFVIEGVLCGIVGGIASVVLLYIAKVAFVDNFLNGGTTILRQDVSTIGFAPLAVIIVLTGAVVGALGSGVTLRRFLRV